MMRSVTSDLLERFAAQRFVVLPEAFGEGGARTLQAHVEELAGWPESPGEWMRYYESARGERMLCRLENFVPFHAALREQVAGVKTLELVSALMGEPACLFKEKINFKLPGGAGFGAHQDAPAFATFGHRYHITMMIAVDAQRVDNGCLELSDPIPLYETLPQAPDGTIRKDVEAELTWRPLEVDAGDVVFFDSYLPHRSPPNSSDRARRAIFVTFNRRAEGERREDYFRAKRAAFPPECERRPGVDYSASAGIYNLGNPIR